MNRFATRRFQPLLRYGRFDRQGFLLAALLVLGCVGAAWFVDVAFLSSDTAPPPTFANEPSSTQAAAGGSLALMEVALAVGILALLALYRWLPGRAQRLAKKNVRIGFLMLFGGYIMMIGEGNTGVLFVFTASILTVYTAYHLIDYLGLWWVVNNILGVGVVIVIGAAIGYEFGPVFLGVFMVAMTVYDHYFANKKRYMFDLGYVVLRTKIPAIILYPTRYRFAWSEVTDGLADFARGDVERVEDEDDDLRWGIGVADCLLPAAFVASLVAHWDGAEVGGVPLVAIAVTLAMGVTGFYLWQRMNEKGSGAGLPPITTATMLTFGVVGVLPWVIGAMA